jgi:hypothetical protein
MAMTGVQGIRPVPDADLTALDGIAGTTRELLR